MIVRHCWICGQMTAEHRDQDQPEHRSDGAHLLVEGRQVCDGCQPQPETHEIRPLFTPAPTVPPGQMGLGL